MNKCPKCGGPTGCLSGASAHPDNWYCEDENGCGWRAWESRTPARPSSASPTCSIAVPVAELQKLEEAREQLYEFLDDKLAERDMIGLANITGQMWRVANTKSWDRQ